MIDWGGVLTGSLDGAMSSWASRDAIEYEHFRDVIRSWVGVPAETRGSRIEPAGAGDGAHGAGAVDRAGGAGVAGDLGEEGPVAGLEQAPDSGPAGDSPVHRLERGEISGGEFERALAVELERRGSPVPADGLLERMLAGLQSLDEDMIRLVRRARAHGIRTALLSNSWGDHYPEQLWDGLFDTWVISGQVGMRKPEPEIFRFTCERLGLSTAECVMVDDLPHNVSAAVAVGMVGVRHQSYPETRAELEVLFDVRLD